MVDSYDSRNGSYDSQEGGGGHTWRDDTVLETCAPGADIILSGVATVYGNASATGFIITGDHAHVFGLTSRHQRTRICDPLSVASLVANNKPSGSPTRISLSGYKTKTLTTPGAYYLSGINLSGESVLTVPSTGDSTFFIDGDFFISDEASFIVPEGVTLTIYITGNIFITGQGKVNQGPPTDLIFYASGTKGRQVIISGNSEFSASLYAPYSDVSLSGNSVIMGTVRGWRVMGSGNARFHCDEATPNW